MRKALIGAGIILIAVLIGYFAFSNFSVTGNVIADNPQGDSNSDNLAGNSIKIISITGDHLRFFIDGVENPEIKVKLGDRVKVEFKSTEGFHDWVIDEFGAATQKVNAGGSSSVEFIADERGTFEYYCSVGQHRANGMKGKFIVE